MLYYRDFWLLNICASNGDSGLRVARYVNLIGVLADDSLESSLRFGLAAQSLKKEAYSVLRCCRQRTRALRLSNNLVVELDCLTQILIAFVKHTRPLVDLSHALGRQAPCEQQDDSCNTD